MNEDMQKGWHSHKTFKNKIVYSPLIEFNLLMTVAKSSVLLIKSVVNHGNTSYRFHQASLCLDNLLTVTDSHPTNIFFLLLKHILNEDIIVLVV